jgi:hypothetical protein
VFKNANPAHFSPCGQLEVDVSKLEAMFKPLDRNASKLAIVMGL